MISIKHVFKPGGFLIIVIIIVLSACNKKVEQFTEPKPIEQTGQALGETIAANPDNSLFYSLVVKGGMAATINNKATAFTMFVPGNNAMKIFINAISGGLVPLTSPDDVFLGFISANISAETAAAIVSYNIIPQALPSASIPSSFPNFQYPTILNPAPALSALLRLTTFPTTRNGAWVNNIPLAGADITAANGVIHPSAFLVTPPQRFLWDRINTDAGLTYLKAAIVRADSGVDATSSASLIGGLSNIGANLTVFAPTDSAFKVTLSGAIYKGLLPVVIQQLTAAYIGAGMDSATATALAAASASPLAFAKAAGWASSPAVFANDTLFNVLTARTVKGIIVYHILGSRAFTNNFPTAPGTYPTLLNSAIPLHPGVSLKAGFGAALPFVVSATVKGLGNATASNLIINPTPLIPEPFGSSDQHYLNGVLHKIDQVLLPQ